MTSLVWSLVVTNFPIELSSAGLQYIVKCKIGDLCAQLRQHFVMASANSHKYNIS